MPVLLASDHLHSRRWTVRDRRKLLCIGDLADMDVYNPYDYVSRVGKYLHVDEDALRLDYKPTREIRKWRPTRQIKPYEATVRDYLDIETSGLDKTEDRVYMVCLGRDGIRKRVFTHRDEEKLLGSLVTCMVEDPPEILIGHNLFSFDLPFIMYRCKVLGVPHPFKMGIYETRITAASVNGEHIKYFPVYWKGVEIIDTFHLAGIYDKINANLPSYGLKDVALAIGAREERRLELSHKEIVRCWEDGDLKTIQEYLLYDIDDTKALADFFIPPVYYQLPVVPMRLQLISPASPAKKWERIYEDYYGDRWTPEPDEKLGYEGGLVWCNPGIYKNCAKIDVSSLYPSLQLTYQLCSRKDIDLHGLSVLKYLTDRRLELKEEAENNPLPRLAAEDKSSKVNINGFYGFSGVGGYPYNDMSTAALTTAYGRKVIRLMLSIMLELGCIDAEGDTDGIYFVPPSNLSAKEVTDEINRRLPDGIKIKLEYSGMNAYIPAAKNYALFFPYKPDKKPITKGIFRKRNRSQLQKTFPIKYLQKYFEDPELAEDYYAEVRESIALNTFPKELLAIREKISKSDRIKQASGLGEIGDIVTYYFSENKRFHKKTGKPIKSEKLPTDLENTEVPYWSQFYLEQLDEMRTEILTVASLTKTSVETSELEIDYSESY